MSTRTLADSLFERLDRALPADQDYAPDDWDTDALPTPVHHYLTHLLRHQRQQEAGRLRRARSDWVDYDHPEVEQAARTYLDVVENHMRVPREEWTDTLRTATHRVAEYLVQPVPTLTSFVFEEADGPVPVARIQWRMRFFGPYAYLRNAIEAYAEKRDQDAFASDVFERILHRVDEGMTEDFDADRWLRLLDPLYETAHCATGREEVPVSLLRTFFEEKRASHVVDRLAEHERTTNAEAIAPDVLRPVLDTAEPPSDTNDAPSPAPEEPPLPSDVENAEASPTASNSEPSPSSERPDEATPMWKQFEQDRSRRSHEADTTDESTPLWAQFKSRPSTSNDEPSSTAEPDAPSSSKSPASETSPEPTLSALEREVFSGEQPPNRSVYVRELFGGDGDAYREVLQRLRTTESWSTASQIIARDVFRAHQVNIYSDAAVHFTNAAEAGFKEG